MRGLAIDERSSPIFAPPVETHHVPAPFNTTIRLEYIHHTADLFLEQVPWHRAPQCPPFTEPPTVQVTHRFSVDPVLLEYRFDFALVDSDDGISSLLKRARFSPAAWPFSPLPTICEFLSFVSSHPSKLSLNRPRYSQVFGHVGERLREQPYLTSWPRRLRCRSIFQNPSAFSLHRAFIGSQRGLGLPFSMLTQSLPRPVLTRRALKTLLHVEPAAVPSLPQPILPEFTRLPVAAPPAPTPAFSPPLDTVPKASSPRPTLAEIRKQGLGRSVLSGTLTHTLRENSYASVAPLPAGSGAYFGYTPREEWFHLNLSGFVLLVADSPGAQALADSPVTHLRMPPYRSAPVVTGTITHLSIPPLSHDRAPFHHLIEDLPAVRPTAPLFSLLGTHFAALLLIDGHMHASGVDQRPFRPAIVPLSPAPVVYRSPQLALTDHGERIPLGKPANHILELLYHILVDRLRHHRLRLEVTENRQRQILGTRRSGQGHKPTAQLRDRFFSLTPANLSAPPRITQPAARNLRVKMARLAGLLETAQKLNALVGPTPP